MNNEEAIYRLKNTAWLGTNKDREETEQAVELAIKALKAEPIRCGECENYIDGRCIEANHHVAAHGNCMGVFGAKRREL